MTIQLRPYQTEANQALYRYFETKKGNPLIVLPTGAGKSLTMADFIKSAHTAWPATRTILLTHVKELIEQDAQAILRYWNQAPLGIWSAGLGRRTSNNITVAGIQSIHRLPTTFAGTDLVIIDEAHLVSKKADTMYGRFINGLRQHNEHLKVIGFTATEFRMDSGLLTQGAERIFTDVAYKADVGDLIKQGYLCPLVSKGGATKADLSQVHTRGGEFVAGELEDAMNKDHLIRGALDEVAQLAHDRQHILGFCAGVAHARRCAELATERGWAADYVTGDMSASERDDKINAFKQGRLRFLFNAMILTTGFDAPHVDCIIMLRPTKSTGLYVQIMGRGLRKHECKENCLVLDFAGNVARHGPIDQIKIKGKSDKGEGVSVAPVKECPQCQALIFAGLRLCPECGHEFPAEAQSPHGTEAADGVVVAALEKPRVYTVDQVVYSRHVKQGKADSMRVMYQCGPSVFDEWLPLEDPRDFVKKHAVSWFWARGMMCPPNVTEGLAMAEQGRIPAPDAITVKRDGKHWRVMSADMGARRMGVSRVMKINTLWDDKDIAF